MKDSRFTWTTPPREASGSIIAMCSDDSTVLKVHINTIVAVVTNVETFAMNNVETKTALRSQLVNHNPEAFVTNVETIIEPFFASRPDNSQNLLVGHTRLDVSDENIRGGVLHQCRTVPPRPYRKTGANAVFCGPNETLRQQKQRRQDEHHKTDRYPQYQLSFATHHRTWS